MGVEGIPKLSLIIARQHHERFDGSGYPDGLKGYDKINILAQIAAIVDVVGALTDQRVHRRSYTITEALEIMTTEMSEQLAQPLIAAFRPRLLAIFGAS